MLLQLPSISLYNTLRSLSILSIRIAKGGCLKHFLFTPGSLTWGFMIQFDGHTAYFSKGLVQLNHQLDKYHGHPSSFPKTNRFPNFNVFTQKGSN